jgi:PAT family beta-lactamase induction signal transducer AmpG
MDNSEPLKSKAWRWIPTLYFSQGIPNVAVATLAVIMYKNLDVPNTQIALYTSWLYLPWVIKPLWSPLIDLVGTKRGWIVALQFVIGAALGLIAFTVPTTFFLQATLAVFWLVAFSSATHDIAADGFYLLALEKPEQAAFVGIRSTFFRLAMIAGQGGVVGLVGALHASNWAFASAWALAFGILAVFFFLVGLYHWRALPRLEIDRPQPGANNDWRGWWTVFSAFFRKPEIFSILGFLLFYRIAEAQLVRMVAPFLLDDRAAGGLALSNQALGTLSGTFGVLALIIGGLVGGYLVSHHGLRKMLWWMVAAMHVPNAVYVVLAAVQPEGLAPVGAALVLEHLGYGFGFTAYMVYMMLAAEGEHKTAHYAICTGFMALGMMLPGMVSGWIQTELGYVNFFWWVLICAVPSIAVCAFIKIDQDFGRKQT